MLVGWQSQLQTIRTGETEGSLMVEPGRGRLSWEIRGASWQRRHWIFGLSWDRGEGRLASKRPGDVTNEGRQGAA